MPQNSGVDTIDAAKNSISGAASQLQEKASELGNKASELGHKAAGAIDSSRDPAASTLDSAASTLHSKADGLPGGEKVVRFAHQTADALGSTAQYVRGHETKQMLNDLGGFVKSNPGVSLITAAALGFLVGRSFRND